MKVLDNKHNIYRYHHPYGLSYFCAHERIHEGDLVLVETMQRKSSCSTACPGCAKVFGRFYCFKYTNFYGLQEV